MNVLISLLLILLFLSGCSTPPVTTLENPDLNRANKTRFSNQYQSVFNGKGPHHAYDHVDFLKPIEKIKKAPRLINIGSFSGYKKDSNFNYHDLIYPHAKLDPQAKDTITWLGHASFLLQLRQSEDYLTDPVFNEFDGIAGWLGRLLNDELKRLGPAPFQASDLKFTDGVVVSHNHYDHLSEHTLNQLADNTPLLLPLGVANNLTYSRGPITEMDWYTRTQIGKTTIHFLPAHHFSRRGLNDWNKTLWGAWLFDDGEHTVFFAGDTGYSPIYKDMQAKYGQFDVCLMPIVAYDYTYRSIHFAPEDAVKAAQDLRCKIVIPWGYGTWLLGYEHVNEPIRRLKRAVKDTQPDFILKILKIGESVNYKDLLQQTYNE